MRILVFIGPSGSGKSTVVRELHQRGVIVLTPSWTTRPRRDGEDDRAIEHRFVTDEEFGGLEQRGFFLEVVTMFGLPYRYGIPPVGAPADHRVPAIMVRAPLVPLVASHYPEHVVYQVESDRAEVYRRVTDRDSDQSQMGTRLAGYDEERSLGRRLATRIFAGATPVPELVASVAQAIENDFAVDRSRGR